MVTQIRVHPEDCLSVLDIMQAIGVDPYDGRSFASMTSTALKALIGFAVKAGSIPAPQEGQFLNRMAPFLDSRNNKRKHDVSEGLYRQAAHGYTPQLEMPRTNQPEPFIPQHAQEVARQMGWTSTGPSSTAAVPLLQDSGDREMLEARFLDLNERLNRKEQLSQEEREEYDHLNRLFFS